MTLHPRTDLTNRFPLFAEIFSDIDFKSVLDFGGNSGNLLHFSDDTISEESYICVDPSVVAITNGTQEFKKAQFYHYDKYNYMYNHNGSVTAELPNLPDVDVVWVYSVFSHTDLHELYDLTKKLMLLNPKRIAISILDMDTPDMLQYFYNKRVADYGSCVDIRTLIDSDVNIAYLVDNTSLITETVHQPPIDCECFLAFYRLEYIKTYFADRGITVTFHRPGEGYVPFMIIDRI